MDDYEAFHGYGFLIISVLLIYKYGYLKQHPKIKLIILAVISVGVIEISLHNSLGIGFGRSVDYILYFLFFFTMIYIIYTSEINRILKVEKRYEATIHNLKADGLELKEQIEKTESDLSSMKEKYAVLQKKINTSTANRIDPSKAKLSPLEESVLRILCQNPKYTNQQIAYYLKTTENSVKQYNKRLFKKLEVASRGEMIQKCSWYYNK